MNYKNIDTVIEIFEKALPNGVSYLNTSETKTITYEEMKVIKKYLHDNEIISDWSDPTAQILTPKGETIINVHGGIENFLQYEQTEKEKQEQITEITNEKLKNDVKLSKWQVKTHWWVFLFGLLGVALTVVSLILTNGE